MDLTRTQSGDVSMSSADRDGSAGFSPGAMLAGRYRIVALAGRGGMGEVYRADDLRLGQSVALKFLPPALEGNAAARERLLDEVRHARGVSHPNVCRVYDVGEVNGRYFLTMEYIDGEDLASLLRRIGRLPPDKALEIARQLLAGLGAAHERGVLHRDLKPANVMIDGRGQARLTDFGLAAHVTAASPDLSGTVAYMAPERFDGKPATIQSDLYAIGLVLYETFTGKPAISVSGSGPAVLLDWQRAHNDSKPPSLSSLVSEVDPAVERAILRCLEKDPTRRPVSAAQVAASLPGGDPLLAALAAGETPSPELVAASGDEGTLSRGKAWLAAGTILAALAVLGPLVGSVQLVNLVPWEQTPTELAGQARKLLRDVGYTTPRADSASWIDRDTDYLSHLGRLQPAARRFVDPSTDVPGPLVFCYRQSPVLLATRGIGGPVQPNDPPAVRAEDALLTYHPSGRLMSLRVVPPAYVAPNHAPPSREWATPLFAAAGLDASHFQPTEPQVTPTVYADERLAWRGTDRGSVLRIEAAAVSGRPVFFKVLGAWAPEVASAPRVRTSATAVAFVFLSIIIIGPLVILALLARRNVRMGRGDRKGAIRVALFVLVTQFIWAVLYRHWTPDPIFIVITLLIGQGLALGMAGVTWLYYLGLEPYMRRRWPHLLIAWARLLEGRWNDALVGRSLLVGVAAGLAAYGALIAGTAASRWLNLPDVVPLYSIDSLNSLGWFLATAAAPVVAPVNALIPMTVLLVARMVLRCDRAAWVALLAVMLVGEPIFLLWLSPIVYPSLAAFIIPGVLAASVIVFTLWKSGLLATAVMFAVALAIDATPLTLDQSRWYAWRTWVVVALIVSLVVWGFRNVLGRQSAFAFADDAL